MTPKTTLALARNSLIFVCLFAAARPSCAQTSGPDVRPLVRIDEMEVTSVPPLLRDEKTTFISRGGYVFLQGSTAAENGTLDGVAGRGFATPSEREEIRDILTRGQIGRQRDCVLFSPRLVGERRITWYGRNGRKNAFRVVSAPDLSSGLPACSAQASSLIEGLETLAGLIVVGGEFFVTPPGP